jgi:hypothetical protein
MASQDPSGIQIDRVHSGAICIEIGERLRAALAGNPNQLPPHLIGLTELLACGASGDPRIQEFD